MMKKSLNRLLFAWRYAVKNFIFNPIRSLLLTLGFLGIFVAVILAFTMNDFFRTYYVSKLEEKYQAYDLIINVSSSGDARFFSTSKMNMSADINEMIVDKAVFFEFDVLLETQLEDRVYVHVFSSNQNDLAKISNRSVEAFDLGINEMVVTTSFAEAYQLKINDAVSLFAKESKKSFTIKDIIQDGKVFTGHSIFIDKDESISFFLSSLSPSLELISPILLKNMYNSVYIDINPSYTYDEVVEELQAIPQYEKLEYTKTIDQNAVDQFVSRNISLFLMMLSIVLISIVYVLQTTLLVYFNEKKAVFSQVHMLGGRKGFSLNLILIEMFLFFTIAFLLSIGISNLILDYGINYLKVDLIYNIKPISIVYSFLMVFILSVIVTYYYFRAFYKVSDMSNLREQGNEAKFDYRKATIMTLSLIIAYLFVSLKFLDDFLDDYAVAIKIGLVLIFILIFPKLLLRIIIDLFGRVKEKSVIYYHLSMLLSKKAFKHYLSVVLIAFLTIMLLVFTNSYMENRSGMYEDVYQMDFILTHVIADFDDVYDEVSSLEHVKYASKINIFEKVHVTDYEQTISQLVSIEQDKIATFFQLDIQQTSLTDFGDNSTLKILLPNRYQKLYGLEIRDKINIYVNPKYGNQEFYISGFFEKHLGDLAFTNIDKVYNTLSTYQAIVVIGNVDKIILRDELLDLYSDKMIRIADVRAEMSRFLYEMDRVTVYLTFVLSVIIACFIIAMINHSQLLFRQTRSNYARLLVIGYSRKKMVLSLIMEALILYLVILISATIGYVFIGSSFAELSVLFGEYEPIKYSSKAIFTGGIISLLVLSFQYAIYIHQVLKVNVAEVIKSY